MAINFGLIPFISILCSIVCVSVSAYDEWKFVVLADWHGAEQYALRPGEEAPAWDLGIETFSYINQTYGGELILAPGDSNAGKWNTPDFIQKFNASLMDNPQEVVLQAGINCYTTTKKLFSEAGYDRFLMAVGDHELGGNNWSPKGSKTLSLPEFRESFVKGFNRDPETNEFLYTTPIGPGDVSATPRGTIFENTSYAYQYKNVLFITLDAFTRMESNYLDRKNGLGGEGVLTCTVTGEHLAWFKRVLQGANNDDSIDHIFVQAHVPIMQPVRKVVSSGQFMDGADGSDFWKAMIDYGVDIYFAGEVHANTVSRASNSKLIQIVSRGNMANNFLTVDVLKSQIKITAYNEIGDKWRLNNNYTVHGELHLTKPSPGKVWVKSSGALKVLDRYSAMVHLDFETLVPLESRQVLGMIHDCSGEQLIGDRITMRGVECWQSLPNKGTFDQQYDAQVANLELGTGKVGQSAGVFNLTSRLGIYATGPHSGGETISYAVWIKTTEDDSESIIVHYGSVFKVAKKSVKNIFTLTLNNGNPNLYIKPDTKLETKNNLNLADGSWHHLGVMMPKKSCLLSEVKITVDGFAVDTEVAGKDENIFFLTSGRVSLGGFGYSTRQYDDFFPNMKGFIGMMDSFYMWGRVMEPDEMLVSMRGDYHISWAESCGRTEGQKSNLYVAPFWKCRKKCSKQQACYGYESYKDQSTNTHQCTLFYDHVPSQGLRKGGYRCARII